MMPKQSYIKKQFKKMKGGTPPKRTSDRFPTHKKMHRRTLKERIYRDFKRLGKDIELLD